MKSFLLLMHGDGGQESRFQVALDLVRAFEGHLTCLHVMGEPGFRMSDYAEPHAVTLRAETEGLDSAAGYRERLAIENIAWEWQEVAGDMPALVSRAAEFADLIILSSQIGRFGYPGSAHSIGDIIVRTDRPVIAVPRNSKGIALSGPATVAWDGSHTANAALRAALPLLHLAGEVTLLEALKERAQFAVEDAAIYLSHHDIHAQIVREPAGTSAVETIRQRIVGQAYLVMGAFGHERIQEGLFGGTTQSMLSHCDLPILLAH